MEFLGASMELTAGTLRSIPRTFLSDTAGHVADDTQILLFTVDAGLVRTVDQYIGDPPAVTAFWA